MPVLLGNMVTEKPRYWVAASIHSADADQHNPIAKFFLKLIHDSTLKALR
jgi:hypothetical protein